MNFWTPEAREAPGNRPVEDSGNEPDQTLLRRDGGAPSGEERIRALCALDTSINELIDRLGRWGEALSVLMTAQETRPLTNYERTRADSLALVTTAARMRITMIERQLARLQVVRLT